METIEHYQLQRRLGSGAFATVWLARDESLDALVAIKLLGDNWVGQPDIVRRFLDEARLLFRAEDPRVVDVFRLGELDTGQPWFAMEYADRGTLEDRPLRGTLALDESIGLITEMGRCIQGVHRLGAVHRDVKPGNFLIRSLTQGVDRPIPGLAPDERLMIGDLGLAKVLANSSGFTVAAGSPLYMAPEQANTSADVTFAADVWSLGVCAWELLTGHAPGDRPDRIPHLLAPDDLPQLTSVRPDVPAAVEVAIRRAMSREPGDRPASIAEFLDELHLGTTSARTAVAAPASPAGADPGRRATSIPASPAGADPGHRSSEPARATSKQRRVLPAVLAAATLVVAIIAGLALSRSGGTTIDRAPDWFDLPDTVSSVEVTERDDETSVIGLMPAGFIDACESFVSDASGAGWQVLRDDCDSPDAVAATARGSQTAVFAQLSDGRVGWQFTE